MHIPITPLLILEYLWMVRPVNTRKAQKNVLPCNFSTMRESFPEEPGARQLPARFFPLNSGQESAFASYDTKPCHHYTRDAPALRPPIAHVKTKPYHSIFVYADCEQHPILDHFPGSVSTPLLAANLRALTRQGGDSRASRQQIGVPRRSNDRL